MTAIARDIFRFLQVLAFIAAILTAVATVTEALKDYRPRAAPAKSPGIYIHSSILPEILEPLGRELGVAHRMHDVLVAELVLQGARVAAVVRKFVAGRVP